MIFLSETNAFRRIITLAAFLFFIIFIIFSSEVAYASDAWIPEGDITSGGYTPPGPIVECFNPDGTFTEKGLQQARCTGMSWLYFKYVGNETTDGQAVEFVPGSTEISGDCAYNGRGFWHFSINSKANENHLFVDWHNVNSTNSPWYGKDIFVYSSLEADWGHRYTYTVQWWKDHKTVPYSTYASINQKIYKLINGKYELMYEATEYAIDPSNANSKVLKDYQTAFGRVPANANKPIPQSIPDTAYAFCSWGDPERTLTGIPIDLSGNRLTSNDGNWTDTVQQGSPAEITAGSVTGYTFLGWRSSQTSGTPSGSVSYTVSQMGDNDITVYAVYGKNPTLTLVAINENGGGILNASMDSKVVTYNGSGEVTASGISGYTFLGIRETACNSRANCGFNDILNDPSSRQTSRTFYNITDNKTVYAVYRLDTYEAKIEVTDNNAKSDNKNKNSTLGWTGNNGSIEKYIKCGSSCSVTYTHYLKQTEGINGTTIFNTYYRNNTGDYILLGRNIGGSIYNVSYGNWSVSPGLDGTKVRDSGRITVSLGNTYSEKLTFRRSITDSNKALVATVKAPYNFENTVSINAEGDIVYAGESKIINTMVTIGDRQNNEVGESYATSVPNAKTKIFINYNNGEEDIIEENLGTISKSDNGSRSPSVNIRDLPAGTKLTIRFCLYPKSSLSDKNITTNFGGENNISNWACAEKGFTIAKKPSFQVWGGGLYSAYNIDLSPSPAIKNNLAGYNNYSPTGSNNTYVFGSFTELGITTTGSIKGLASGAATGYTTNNNGTLFATPGGSTSTDYCNLSPLSIPNNNCSGATGYVGISSDNSSNNNSTDTSDRSSLISRFTEDNATDEAFKNYTIVTPENCNGNDCTLEGIPNLNNYKGDTDDNGVTRYTKIINVGNDKNLTITDNITYDNGQTYKDLETIPKIIIYAKDIKIACNVGQIDAVLLAEEDIDTCYDAGDENDQKRSKQLTINGSIITDTLHLERTYGAATGNNSIIPAEIINYDSTLYLWANSQAGSNNTGRLTTTYIHDLAPRY